MPVSKVSETTPTQKAKKPTLQDADLGKKGNGNGKGKKADKPKPVDMPTVQMPASKITSYFGKELFDIPFDQIDFITDEKHPGYEEDRLKAPVNKDLAASLAEHGQLEPGHLYPSGNGRYTSLSGMQRIKAFRYNIEQGDKSVMTFRAFVAKPDLGDMGAVAVSVIANEFSLLRTNEGRAAVMRRSLKTLGYFNPSTTADDKTAYVKTVAAFFGVAKQTVRNALYIWEKAAPAVRAALNEGIIKETTAARLAAKPKAEQESAITSARNAIAKQQAAATATNVDGSASKRAGSISESKLLGGKPSTALLRELVGQKDVPADASNLLQYVTGDLDKDGAIALLPWLRKGLSKCTTLA